MHFLGDLLKRIADVIVVGARSLVSSKRWPDRVGQRIRCACHILNAACDLIRCVALLSNGLFNRLQNMIDIGDLSGNLVNRFNGVMCGVLNLASLFTDVSVCNSQRRRRQGLTGFPPQPLSGTACPRSRQTRHRRAFSFSSSFKRRAWFNFRPPFPLTCRSPLFLRCRRYQYFCLMACDVGHCLTLSPQIIIW